MIVKIEKLTLKNFKGVQDLTIEPEGKNISISGENETGKTSVADGFFWLMFEKDLTGSSDSQFKPVNKDGSEIHNIETSVEATLDIDGTQIKLAKVYYEKYTKKHGSAVKEFGGHSTDYFLNDVPTQKKDYDKKIEELFELSNFKLVSNPFAFAEMHWLERRKLLLEICGDVTDEDVIESDPGLSRLTEILGKSSLEDHKKKTKSSQKLINEKLKLIPAQIAENKEASKEVEKPSGKDKKIIEAELKEAREKLRLVESNEATSSKQIKVNEIIGAIQQIIINQSLKAEELKTSLGDSFNDLKEKRYEAKRKIDIYAYDVKEEEKRLKTTIAAMDATREKWKKLKAEEVITKESCPTCSQPLPADQIEAAVKRFNIQKSEKLEAISKEGKSLKSRHDERLDYIEKRGILIETLTKTLTELNAESAEIAKKLNQVCEPDLDLPEIDPLTKEKSALEHEIAGLKNGNAVQVDIAEKAIAAAEAKLSDWNKTSAAWDAYKKSFERISELELREKELARNYEELEADLFLISKFEVRKVEMLEGPVNERFKPTTFKLFNQQVNGGIEPCCEILYNGVPYSRGLNKAGRVNTGISNINTLAEHFGFVAPIWVDDREGVNKLAETKAQVINLIVSKDKKLKIEKE